MRPPAGFEVEAPSPNLTRPEGTKAAWPNLEALGRGAQHRVNPVASTSGSDLGSRVPGEIRVEGMLRLAPDTLYEGDVHARGGLLATPGSIVAGDVYTDGPVQLAATARIGGSVRPSQADHADSDTESPTPEPGSCGLEGLLELAQEGQLAETDVQRALEGLQEAVLDDADPEGWSLEAVRETLYGQGFARLAPVTIEEESGGFLLRIRRDVRLGEEAASSQRLTALEQVARRLGQGARPDLSLHPLSSADSPGDVVLLGEA